VGRTIRIAAFGLRSLEGVEGGIETHASELYPRLAGLGYDITVLTRSRYDTGRRVRPAGCRTRPIWAPTGKGFEAAIHTLVCVGYCALLVRPDIVHVHGVGPGACAPLLRLAGLRVVLTHHGHDYDAVKWGWLARRLLRIAETFAVRFGHEVICVSENIRTEVARLNARTRTIRNGVQANMDTTRRPTSAALAGLAPDSYVLVVGRLTAHKRVLDVLTALNCPALEGVKLVICGDVDGSDPYIDAVKLAAARNPNVVLAGFVDRSELPWLYRHALCSVMASSYEGMPFAVLEALACGSVVLVSELPAHREIGLAAEQYFPVGGIDELRHKIERVRADPTARQRLARPPALDTRFDWDVIARASASVFETVWRDPLRPDRATESLERR
jgi:glycosyltransferase involved in cell wall biosynthesis